MPTLQKPSRTSHKLAFSFGKKTDTCTDLVVQTSAANADEKLLTALTRVIEDGVGLPKSPTGASSKPSGTAKSLRVSYAGGRAYPSAISEAMSRLKNRHNDSWSSANWHTHIIPQEGSLRHRLSEMVCSCGHPAWSHKDLQSKCAGCHADGKWAGTSYGGHDNCNCKGFVLDYRKSFPTAEKQAKAAIEFNRDIAYLEGVQAGTIDPLDRDRAYLKVARDTLSEESKKPSNLTKAALRTHNPSRNRHRSDDITRARDSVHYWQNTVKSHYYVTDSIASTLALVKPIAQVITPKGFNFDLAANFAAIEEVAETVEAPVLDVVIDVHFPENFEEFMLALGKRRSFTELTMQEHFDLFQWQTTPEKKAASARALNDCTRRDAEYEALQAFHAMQDESTEEDSLLFVEGMTMTQWLSAMPKVSLNGRQKALALAVPGTPLVMTAAQYFL